MSEISPHINVSIPSTTTVGTYILYDLEIILVFNKFRSERYRISKRFSDFIELRKQLINLKFINLPELPSKYSSFYKNNEILINERKMGLNNFIQVLLDNSELRIIENVLAFFNIPKSIMIEFNILNTTSNESEKNEIIETKKNVNKIDSAQQWMDIYKLIKSLMQDSRTKMFNSGNVIEIRKNLKNCEDKLYLLKVYLSNTKELGIGEIRRRKDLLNSLNKELTELNNMLQNMKFNEPINEKNNDKELLFNTYGKNTGSGRRTFGKAKETEETKSHDSKGLLQMQEQKMQLQNEDLDVLKDMIVRQKQLGIAVNEELTIQNELLKGLNQQVDQSTNKLNVAKSKVNKFL
jgi:regulator of vacuolar morphogenesis